MSLYLAARQVNELERGVADFSIGRGYTTVRAA